MGSLSVCGYVSHTAVDVMPFLGRTDYGGPFNAYFEALSNLGSEYVRYAPWFPNPRVVVTELTPSDCTATKPATNWNSTLFGARRSHLPTEEPVPLVIAEQLHQAQRRTASSSWCWALKFSRQP